MIPPMLELLLEEEQDYYAKCAQMGWAKNNMKELETIKRKFTEILDVYAK